MHGWQLQMLGAQDGGVGGRVWWSELSLSLAARPTAVRGRGEMESRWVGARDRAVSIAREGSR